MSGQARPSSAKRRLGRGLSSLIVNSSAPQPQGEGVYQPVSQADNAALPAHEEPTRAEPPGKPLASETLQKIPVDQIGPNPYQPRRDFREEDLAELAESITRQGVLQPLVVTKSRISPENAGENEKPFVLIAGERRLRASQRAGLEEVPCVLREATGQQMLEWALVENIHRRVQIPSSEPMRIAST